MRKKQLGWLLWTLLLWIVGGLEAVVLLSGVFCARFTPWIECAFGQLADELGNENCWISLCELLYWNQCFLVTVFLLFLGVCLILGVIKLFRWIGKIWNGCKDKVKTDFVRRGADDPIESCDDDKAHRKLFVRHFLRMLDDQASLERSQYVGLFGAWGSGKTSIYNLLKEECKKEGKNDTVFVDFKPWGAQKFHDQPYVLFEAIAAGLKDRYPSLAKKFSRLSTLAELKKTISDVASTNGWLAALHFMFWGFRSGDDDVVQLRKALKTCGYHIIVVVDDLDRCLREDVLDVLRVLKVHGDLPCVTYLILADYDYLVESVQSAAPLDSQRLREDCEFGKRYLEKLITCKVDLPPMNSKELMAELRNLLSDEIEKCGFDRKILERDQLDVVSQLISNFRDLKRFMLSFQQLLSYMLIKSPERCFCVQDVIALAGMKMFTPSFYNTLTQSGDKLLSDINDSDYVERTYINIEPLRSRRIIEKFLRIHLCVQKYDGADGAKVYKHETLGMNVDTNYRMASRKYFWLYFRDEDIKHVVTSKDKTAIASALEEKSDKAYVQELLRLHREGRLDDYLNNYVDGDCREGDSVLYVAQGLSKLADEDLFDPQTEMQHWDCHWNDYQLYWKIAAIVANKLYEMQGRFGRETILACLHKSLLVSGALITGEYDARSGGSNILPVLGENFQLVKDRFLTDIAEAKRTGRLEKCDKRLMLERFWFEIVEHEREAEPMLREEFIKLHGRDAGKFPQAAVLIMLFKQFRSYKDEEWITTLNYDLLLQYVRHPRTLLRTLNTNNAKLTRELNALTICLDFCISQKGKHQTYDIDSQKQHLRSVWGKR